MANTTTTDRNVPIINMRTRKGGRKNCPQNRSDEPQLLAGRVGDVAHDLAELPAGLSRDPAAVLVLRRQVDRLATDFLDLDPRDTELRPDFYRPPFGDHPLGARHPPAQGGGGPEKVISRPGGELWRRHDRDEVTWPALLHQGGGHADTERPRLHEVFAKRRDK